MTARPELGSKLNVRPISSTPPVGRPLLADRRLQRLLRQPGLVADHRDRGVRGDRDRPAALERLGGARRVEDLLQPGVLGLDERRLVSEPRVIVRERRHAPAEQQHRDDRDPDRDAPRRALVDQRPAAERDRDAEREQQRRDRHVARDHRQPGGGDDQERRGAERAERERQRRAAAQDVDGEQEAEPADPDGDDAVAPPGVLGDVLDRVEHAAVAPELARHLARRRERVQRLAGHDQVPRHPDQRCGDDEQRVADQHRPRRHRREVEPVDAAEQPRLGSEQPGERQHEQHRPAAARAAQLEQRRAEHHQVERQVEHRPQREQLDVGAGEHHRDRDQRDQPAEQPLGEHERHDVEREQPEQRREHEDAVARGAERGHRPPDQRGERVRRRRAEHVVVRQLPVAELLAPHERVVGVVVGIRPVDDEHEQHDQRAHARSART